MTDDPVARVMRLVDEALLIKGRLAVADLASAERRAEIEGELTERRAAIEAAVRELDEQGFPLANQCERLTAAVEYHAGQLVKARGEGDEARGLAEHEREERSLADGHKLNWCAFPWERPTTTEDR